MGCASSAQATHEVERVLTQAETDSGMKQLKSTDVDYAVRKHSVGGMVSAEQVRTIADTLAISMTNHESAKCGDFFKSFQPLEGCERNPLLVTLLLLSSSPTPREKMELLFEVFDPKSTGLLTSYQLSELVKHMLKAAILYVPKLLPKHAKVKTIELAAYLSHLEVRLKLGAKILTDRILCGRNQVNLTQFLTAATDRSFDDISRCGGLREFVENVKTAKRVRSMPMKEKTSSAGLSKSQVFEGK